MQVSVEAPSKLERRITVTVPIETIDDAFNKRMASLAKTAKLKGFRPGKVPLNYLKQQYGDSVRQEALSDVIKSSLSTAIQQENLHPVTVPNVEPKSLLPGQPLEYIATFEIFPEIGTVNFSAKTLEKETAEVRAEDVDHVIDRLREQHTTWNEVSRPAETGDQVIIDFRGTVDGKAFQGGEAHDYPVIIGSKQMIPGFEEGLIATHVGDEKTVPMTFPSDYFAKELAGQAAEFAVQVHKISEPQTPPLNEDLIKKMGVKSGSLEDLRAEIQKNLHREVERVTKGKLKAKLFDALLEQNSLEIPKGMIQEEAKRIHDQVHPHHGKEHHHSAAEMLQFEEAAKKNIGIGLLVSALIKQHKITPDKSRIDSHLANLASVYENPSEVIQWYAQDKRRLADVEMQIMEEQVVEKLLEGITITEKLLKYNELLKG